MQKQRKKSSQVKRTSYQTIKSYKVLLVLLLFRLKKLIVIPKITMSGVKKKQIKQKKKPKPPIKHLESSFANSDNESDFDNCQNDELSQAIGKLSHKFNGETKKIGKLLQSFDYFSQEIKNLVKRIEGLAKTNQQLKTELKLVKENETKLEMRIQQLEIFTLHHKQSYKNNNMIITNLPKFSGDTNPK